MIASFEQYPRDWHVWFTSAEPENATLPGEWENACNELERMLIVRSIRADRVSFCVTSFIINNLGLKFVEPPPLDMRSVLEVYYYKYFKKSLNINKIYTQRQPQV